MTRLGLDVITTINTHTIDDRFLNELVIHGASVMRVNGAHVRPDQIPRAVELIRSACGRAVRILVDLPGNKVRTRGLPQDVTLHRGERFELGAEHFSVETFLRCLKEGDVVVSSDGQLTMVVEAVDPERVSFLALCDGRLLNNKGVHLPRASLVDMPLLLEEDRALLDASVRSGVDFVGFSFVRTAEDAEAAYRVLDGTGVTPIIKLETKEATALETVDAILARAEIVLIDRGDLASEVGIAAFPLVFNRTLEKAVAVGRTVFVATQLFASMVDHNLPYLSEVIEFHRLANSGIRGVQLSEEIAVGRHPLEVLKLIAALTGEAAG